MKIFHLDVSVFFSSFDKIFHLACFVSDFDDFYFWKWGTYFPGHFWDFSNKYKKSIGNLTFCYIQILKVIKKVKVKGISHLGTNM